MKFRGMPVAGFLPSSSLNTPTAVCIFDKSLIQSGTLNHWTPTFKEYETRSTLPGAPPLFVKRFMDIESELIS